ncbi:unnamed protein product [Ectocarpus sp. 4 AP-2014]
MIFLSRNSITILMGTVFTILLGICAMLQHVVPEVYGENPTEDCMYLGDWWFWCPSCFLMILSGSRLFSELLRLQDRINMAKEISTTACVWLVMAVPYHSIIVLNAFDVVDMPRQLSFVLWLCIALTQMSTFMIEPRREYGELSCCKLLKKTRICVDDASTNAWRETWHDSKVIMSNPILDQAFEKHVQDYLCSESYDFVKEVERYVTHAENESAAERFVHFRRIVDKYIVSGSELELNIENAMRNKVLEVGERMIFVEAGMERQRDIFNPSKEEAHKILDDNLLQSFLASRKFLDACLRWQEAQAAAASASDKISVFGWNSHQGSFGGISRSVARVHGVMSREIGRSRKSSIGRRLTEIGASTIREEIRRVGSRLDEHATHPLCPVHGQEKKSEGENK